MDEKKILEKINDMQQQCGMELGNGQRVFTEDEVNEEIDFLLEELARCREVIKELFSGLHEMHRMVLGEDYFLDGNDAAAN